MSSLAWIKALHIIFMVTWFAALFYLPRLFVYHAMSDDGVSQARFKVMEHKLYYYIMTPGGILTSFFGFWLLFSGWSDYKGAVWMMVKLFLVGCLWVYHFCCGWLLHRFRYDDNPYTHVFYRYFNEIPSVILIVVVVLAEVQPRLSL